VTAASLTVELKSDKGAPLDVTAGFSVGLVWKAVSYDRMQTALRTFAVDEYSVTGCR
jgi:regulator of nonsense transcripts 1